MLILRIRTVILVPFTLNRLKLIQKSVLPLFHSGIDTDPGQSGKVSEGLDVSIETRILFRMILLLSSFAPRILATSYLLQE